MKPSLKKVSGRSKLPNVAQGKTAQGKPENSQVVGTESEVGFKTGVPAGNVPAWSGVPVVVPVVVVPIAVPVDEAGNPRAGTLSSGTSAADTPVSGALPKRLPHRVPEILPKTKIQRFLRTAGGTGFLISLFFHLIFLGLAVFVAFTQIIEKPPEPDAFVSGAGGGRAGENLRESFAENAFKMRPKPENRKQKRLISKSPTAKISLPELDLKMPETRSEPVARGTGMPEMASGAGGSIGGGIANGKGIGIGRDKNFVGKFTAKNILGAKVYADKIAVYLDCSGSMTPYLARVKEAIYEKFPEADVFEFDGVRTEVVDGELVGARNGKRMKSVRNRPRNVVLDSTDVKKLTPPARRFHKKYAENFAAGSLGAWLDVIVQERYDALVVFSDFEDGIRQYDKNEKTIFADSSYAPTNADKRTPKDLRWYKIWEQAFSRKDAPKLYLFSIAKNPQDFLRKCVEQSKGGITDVSYLRKEAEKTRRTGKKQSIETIGEPDDADELENAPDAPKTVPTEDFVNDA